jgi:hypothetical protein
MPLHTGLCEHAARQVDWPRVLCEYDVRFLALDVEADVDLLQRFQSHPDWTVDIEDGGAVLLTRRHANGLAHNKAGQTAPEGWQSGVVSARSPGS